MGGGRFVTSNSFWAKKVKTRQQQNKKVYINLVLPVTSTPPCQPKVSIWSSYLTLSKVCI